MSERTYDAGQHYGAIHCPGEYDRNFRVAGSAHSHEMRHQMHEWRPVTMDESTRIPRVYLWRMCIFCGDVLPVGLLIP